MTSQHRRVADCARVRTTSARRKLLQAGGIATLTLGLGGLAHAQDSGRVTLEEITVTATRQTDTVNRIPLSIQAVTQEHLDQQGVKSIADLVRAVPGLNTVQTPGGSQQTFSIRGIVGGTGAATTGTYLDDTNLAKRANGGIAQNNGVVVPLLYDLERVEVLKGPQGTLYGGSSQGGTVRFITPQPSLTEFSGSTRAEVSTMGSRSELSHEFGAAFGGPLVQDKLGFRVSGIRRETGGWIDLYSGYTGRLIEEDANGRTEWAGRLALSWQISDGINATLSGYHTTQETEGGPGSQTALFLPGPDGKMVRAPAGQTWTTQQRCITNNQRTNPLVSTTPGAPGGTVWVPPNVIVPAGAACPPGTVYVRPAQTYGPYRTGRDIAIATTQQYVEGQTSELDVASLTLTFNFGDYSFKSVSSYLRDETESKGAGGEAWTATIAAGNTAQPGQATYEDPTHRGFPLFRPYFDATGRGNSGYFDARNKRDGFEQEFRLSSNPDNRFSWVAGAYYADLETKIRYRWPVSEEDASLALQLLYGPDLAGPPPNTSAATAYYGNAITNGFQSYGDTIIKDKEAAIFAEANLWIVPDKLKAIAGLRYSKVELDFWTLNHGQQNGRLPTSFGSLVEGKASEKPVTPKVGLQYNFADDKMVYATAAKGFRAGGVNPAISPTFCAQALDQLGLTATDIPLSFDADTVWSYELGSKFRLWEVMQVNVAAFRIDWEDIQATTTLSCGQGFTKGGGKARSEGAELSVQYRPNASWNMYLYASYTDAYYVDPVRAPTGANATTTPAPSFNAGDKFDIPPFSMSAGVTYDFNIAEIPTYVRLDGTYQDDYIAGATFGASGFGSNYFNRYNVSRQQLNLRAGMRFGNGLDVNVFVNNLTNEDKLIAGRGDGRGQCSAASIDCATYSSYSPFVAQTYQTPRVFGLQANYRFGGTN
jgi:iron complex outermembrane receptor protein